MHDDERKIYSNNCMFSFKSIEMIQLEEQDKNQYISGEQKKSLEMIKPKKMSVISTFLSFCFVCQTY